MLQRIYTVNTHTVHEHVAIGVFTSNVLNAAPSFRITGSKSFVSVLTSNTNTKLKMKAFLEYLLSSMPLGEPTILYPNASLQGEGGGGGLIVGTVYMYT